MSLVVKKVEAETKTVFFVENGVIDSAPFDNFLELPKVNDTIELVPARDGSSKYVVAEDEPASVNTVYVTNKSKLAAGLLGIFLGSLGIHNFYLGKTGKAVTQLLFSTIGWITFGILPAIAGIWGFIEGILILVSTPGSDWHQDARGNELQD
ncbi:MAG: TM2 domain-containing protein [Lactobacillaceae bacterium]|jgi:TM2 domain-containing membrane protein YozV|nr:TM2 domain-containing protein [Lactobacillaceae bacterium]